MNWIKCIFWVVTWLILFQFSGLFASWEEWWTYDGISGPDFWGLLNPEWWMCSKGRRQSPIDLDPSILLYDPNLQPFHVDKHRINGFLINTGHSVVFKADTDVATNPINITGGPLSYSYRFDEIHLHFGRSDTFGSEHTVAGYSFPAEVQIFGYNQDLYTNMTDALHGAQGLVGIALLTQLGELSNLELRLLTSQLHHIKYRGQQVNLRSVSVRELLSDTEWFMTYEGSITMPGCQESVTWIIVNRPIYITKQQLYALRKLMQGDPEIPKAPVGNNFRPPQPLHYRPVRTNINVNRHMDQHCPASHKNVHYEVGKKYEDRRRRHHRKS